MVVKSGRQQDLSWQLQVYQLLDPIKSKSTCLLEQINEQFPEELKRDERLGSNPFMVSQDANLHLNEVHDQMENSLAQKFACFITQNSD